MAEIVPQGNIWVLKNVPLSPDYNNTLWFQKGTDARDNQRRHFQEAYNGYSFANESYQRKNRGWLRLKAPYKNLYNCNYMMWKNLPARDSTGAIVRSMYEDKWWYAFVDNVVYINDGTTEIHYTIDLIQSYMFDIQYEDTYVERYTVTNDTAGANMIDEGLPVGDYVYANCEAMQFKPFNSSYSYSTLDSSNYPLQPVIAATCDRYYHDTTDGATITTQRSNIVLGCQMIDPQSFSPASTAKDWLDNLPGEKQGAVLGIQMTPKPLRDYPNVPSYESKEITRPTTLQGYTPYNKKLLSYPFNALTIINSEGASQLFDYYTWTIGNSDTIKFKLDVVYTFPIQGILYPQFYKKNSIASTYALPLPTLPTCTWSNDTFKAWAAMNTGFVATSIAGSVVDAAVRIGDVAMSAQQGGANAFASTRSMMTAANAAQGISGLSGSQVTDLMDATAAGRRQGMMEGLGENLIGITNDIIKVTNELIKVHNAKILPDSFNGSAQGLATVIGHNYGFFSAQRCVRSDYAKQIDDYFTMFGYKVLTIMTLSHEHLKVRERFTYIKTINMDIRGDIPSDDRNAICSIFNNGIRFWFDYAHIGDYNMSLRPNDPI